MLATTDCVVDGIEKTSSVHRGQKTVESLQNSHLQQWIPYTKGKTIKLIKNVEWTS